MIQHQIYRPVLPKVFCHRCPLRPKHTHALPTVHCSSVCHPQLERGEGRSQLYTEGDNLDMYEYFPLQPQLFTDILTSHFGGETPVQELFWMSTLWLCQRFPNSEKCADPPSRHMHTGINENLLKFSQAVGTGKQPIPSLTPVESLHNIRLPNKNCTLARTIKWAVKFPSTS